MWIMVDEYRINHLTGKELFIMSTSLLIDAESKLKTDHDGSYKAQLIQRLEEYRDEFSFKKQELLPPDDNELLDKMENAVNSAMEIIKVTNPAETDDSSAVEENQELEAPPTMISV
jgi:hypothetical protein